MPTYRFEEVTHPVTKRVPCRVCRKPLSRSTILSQTINPFNLDIDGVQKTRQQIREELRELAETWHPTNDIHRACIPAEQAAETAKAAS